MGNEGPFDPNEMSVKRNSSRQGGANIPACACKRAKLRQTGRQECLPHLSPAIRLSIYVRTANREPRYPARSHGQGSRGDTPRRGVKQPRGVGVDAKTLGLAEKSEHADDDEVDRDDSGEQSRTHQDENPGDQGNGGTDVRGEVYREDRNDVCRI